MCAVGAEIGRRIAWKTKPSDSISIFCGPGNNGGDGLRIGLKLLELGRKVRVYVIDPERKHPAQWREWAELLKAEPTVTFAESLRADLIVDAVLGAGQDRETKGVFLEFVRWANSAQTKGSKVWSVDQPTSWYEGFSAQSSKDRLRVDYCFCVGAPRLEMLLYPESRGCLGFEMIRLNGEPDVFSSVPAAYSLTQDVDFERELKLLNPHSSKSDRGSVVVCAGSETMPGAAALSCRAALRSGSGRVWLSAPGSVFRQISPGLPELMSSNSIETSSKNAVWLVGPGLGRDFEAVLRLKSSLERSARPMILDADALFCLAEQPELQALIPKGSILCPHIVEFDRFFESEPKSGRERLERARIWAQNQGCILILKGRHTAVCLPDGSVRFNPNGNAILSIPGSGDVLSGLLAGLLARGLSPSQTAIAAVFLHGRTGDLLRENNSETGLLAHELADGLRAAFLEFGI